MESNGVTAIVPAYNEADIVRQTVSSLLSSGSVRRVILADDGSTDDTAELARQAGAEVLSCRHLGKGGAVNAALDGMGERPRVLLLADADLGDGAASLFALVRAVEEGADLAIAAFPPAQRKGGLGFVKGMARGIIGRYGDAELVSPLSGQRAFSPAALAAATPFRPGYAMEVACTVACLKAGLKVVEVPLPLTHRETGRDAAGFRHRGRQFLDIVRYALRG